MSIPVCLIWRLKMSVRQKIAVGAFLTMNIWLIIIAVIRATTFKHNGHFDNTWICFCQFLEPNIAIFGTCFSAFRSIFVAKGSKASEEKERPSRSLQRFMFRKTPSDHRPLDDLPTFPNATLTGLSIFRGENAGSHIITSNRESNLDPVGNMSEQDAAYYSGRIHVKQAWSLNSTRV